MKKRVFISFAIFTLFSGFDDLKAQEDFTFLLATVEKLEKKSDHETFLARLYARDQSFRGEKADLQNDHENLVLAVKYMQTYGFPSDDFGRYKDILGYIWVHQWLDEVQEYTFSMIWNGYKSGAISQEHFRNYFLRGLYRKKFGDSGFQTLSNRRAIEKLDVNIHQELDDQYINGLYDNYKHLLTSMNKDERQWCTKEKYKEYRIGTKVIVDTIHSEKIYLAQYEGKTYFKRGSKQWREDQYRLLGEYHASEKRKGKSRYTREVDPNGDLILRDNYSSFEKKYRQSNCPN